MADLFQNPLFLGIALFFMVLEIFWRKKSNKTYDFKALGATFAVMAGQIASKGLFAGLIGFSLVAAYELAPVQWSVDRWQTWAMAFVGVEFAYYWQHRWSHTIRWMWANHSVHHSPNEFVLPAAFRLGWTSALSGGWLVYVPLAVGGFHPLVITTVLIINLRFQYFLHTEHVGRLGPLEWLFNTPSNHRVHHSSRPEYLDKNFGGVLMVFDHLFGTYAAEKPGVDLRYGLTDPLTTYNPFLIALREWGRLFRDVARAPTVRGKLCAAFGPPAAPKDQSADLLPNPKQALRV